MRHFAEKFWRNGQIPIFSQNYSLNLSRTKTTSKDEVPSKGTNTPIRNSNRKPQKEMKDLLREDHANMSSP